MKYLILGLGIIAGHIFLRDIYTSVAHLFVGPRVNVTYHLVMLFSEVSIILGIVFAYYLIKITSLSSRLATPIQGLAYIKVGVWLFLLFWLMFLITRLLPYAIYLVGSFPPAALVLRYHNLAYSIANLIIFIGLFHALLPANPIRHDDS